MLNTQPQTDLEMVEETTQPLTLEQKLQNLADQEIKIDSVSFGKFFQRAQEEAGASLEQLEEFTEGKLVFGAGSLPMEHYETECEWEATGRMYGKVSISARTPIAAARKFSEGYWDDHEETDHHDSYPEDIELDTWGFEALCKELM